MGKSEKNRKKGYLREKMPDIADFIDRLREVFGEEQINDTIRRGMAGEPVFYVEGKVDGKTVRIGTPPKKGTAVYLDKASGVWYTKGDSDE